MEKEMDLSDLERVLTGKGSQYERWEWRIKGTDLWHHPTQPALQYTEEERWAWYWMDRPHRWDGPSSLWNGQYNYSIKGVSLTRDQWLRDPRRLQWLMENKLEGI